jgi:hypothetical protein
VATTFGVLYSMIGVALLVAPTLLPSWGWQFGQRINWAGCGVSLVGHLLGAAGFLLYVGNGLAGEGASDSVSLVANLGVVAGVIVAVGGDVLAAVGRS